MNRVSEIMNKECGCCTPLTKIEDSKELMEKYDCTRLTVVNSMQEKRIVGMVNKADFTIDAQTVIQCMSKDLRVIDEDSSVDECLRVMIINNIEQVPVVDKQGHLCGVVTEKALLKK